MVHGRSRPTRGLALRARWQALSYDDLFAWGLLAPAAWSLTHMRALCRQRHTAKWLRWPIPGSGPHGGQAPGISVHADLAGMLRAGRLDGVLIASSSDTHLAGIAEPAAAAGIPILCEKPCGLTSSQGREAAAIAA